MKLTDAELDIARRAKAAYDKDPVTTLFSPMWIEMLCDAADDIDALRAENEELKAENERMRYELYDRDRIAEEEFYNNMET
jgi:cell division protein FtsB